MHDDPRLLPPWRGSSSFPGQVHEVIHSWAAVPNPGASGWHAVEGSPTLSGMTPTAVVLTLLSSPDLVAEADRVIAAAGARMLRPVSPGRQDWLTATAVLVDEASARLCEQQGMPRREGVVLVGSSEPSPQEWAAAIAVGAQRVYAIPGQEDQLVHAIAEAAERGSGSARNGRIIAVIPGRGGGGASVFAAALTQCAREALLIDLDPYAGGIDLLMGTESVPGLRWPDITAQGGRLGWSAVRSALPSNGSVTVLSSARGFHDVDPRLVSAMAEAGRRGGSTVVCDLPRQVGAASAQALELADLVAVVTGCDVRGVAAASALTAVLRTVNPNVGLVVRGPAPGGLRARDAVEIVAAPLLAAMRPEPMLAQRIEQAGLRLRRRSPLAVAARRVLSVAHQSGSAE